MFSVSVFRGVIFDSGTQGNALLEVKTNRTLVGFLKKSSVVASLKEKVARVFVYCTSYVRESCFFRVVCI